MTIPTNVGSGGPDLQSTQDAFFEHWQGVLNAPAIGRAAFSGVPSPALKTPEYIVVNVASSGDNVLLAGQGAGKQIYVISGVIVSSGDVNVTFFSDPGYAPITGPIPLISNSGFILPYNTLGNFRTEENNALVVNLSASVTVAGWLTVMVS